MYIYINISMNIYINIYMHIHYMYLSMTTFMNIHSVKLQLHICLGLYVLVSSGGRKQSQFLILAQKCNKN